MFSPHKYSLFLPLIFKVKNTKKIDRDVLLEKYVRKIVRLGNILKNTKKLTGEVGEIKLFWKIN